MPAPVIEPRTSLQVAKKGEAFTFQLAAFNVPATWTGLYLPPGLTINNQGLITGTPTTPGLYQVAIRANNADGLDQIFVLITVLAEEIDEEHMGEWNDLVLDFDLTTRQLAIHGKGAAVDGDGAGLFPMAEGDAMNLLVGFYRDGVLRDVNPNGEHISVKLALKEFEPERLLTLEGGSPEKVVVGDSVRYRINAYLDPKAWLAVLSNYEEDEGTRMLALSEIELMVGGNLYSQSKATAPFELKGGMTGNYGENPKINRTLTFNGFTDTVPRDYQLKLQLNVWGRPSQNVTLNRALKLAKPGGAWVVSNETGPTSIQGPGGSEWQVTMENTDIDGLASAVDVDVEFTTTIGSSSFNKVWIVHLDQYPMADGGDLGGMGPISFPFSFDPYITLWGDPSLIGEKSLSDLSPGGSGVFPDAASLFATIKATCDFIMGHDTQVAASIVDSQTLKITAPQYSPIYALSMSQSLHGGVHTSATTETHPQTAVLTGTLTQTSGKRPDRYTGQFGIDVMRGMVPDN